MEAVNLMAGVSMNKETLEQLEKILDSHVIKAQTGICLSEMQLAYKVHMYISFKDWTREVNFTEDELDIINKLL